MAVKDQENRARRWGANIGMAVLALAISVGLWVYAVVVTDPNNSLPMENISVTYNNEGVFNARSLILTSSSLSVDIILHGSMSDLAALRRENITVTVDLSQIEGPGDHELRYDVALPTALGGQSVTWSRTTQFVRVTADHLDTRTFECKLIGGEVRAAEGFLIRRREPDPQTVQVTGPVTLLDRISYAGMELPEIQPISSTKEFINLPVKLYDAEGKPVVSEHLTTDVTEAAARFTVLMEKSVPVVLEFKDGGGLTQQNNISYESDPPEVVVVGDPELINAYYQFVLGTVKLAELLESGPEEFTEWYPPNGIELINPPEKFTVGIEIYDVLTDTRQVAPYASGYTPPAGYRLVIHTGVLDITLRGSREALAAVSTSNLRAVIDLSEITLPPEEKQVFDVTLEVPDSVSVGIIGGPYQAFVELVPIGEEENT